MHSLCKNNSKRLKVKNRIFKQLDSEYVLLYSKSTCKYCAYAKKFFIDHHIEVTIVELDLMDGREGEMANDILAEITD